MSPIHDSLKALGPVSFSEVPQDLDGRKKYLSEHLSAGKFLVESIPQPTQQSSSRSRAVSSASSSAEISSSTARTETPSEHESLQKDWGKPIKLSEKDNPLGINVFKLAGKDGRGAWFARRSVHEGLSFGKWKKGLQEEFEHSLQVQGGPGSGKVRGLGAEQRPESFQVDGVGTLDVWHVSAQFPGPSAPRDFVSLVMTSDTILGQDSPNHFMVVSTPCEHQNCPPQDGLVRGQYESVEFIREIPRSTKAASTTDLNGTSQTNGNEPTESDNAPASPGRARGRTIGFAESRGHTAKGESIDKQSGETDPAPVEWIMITRSDPGGSVPRFLVDRGTPGGIVSDASKFLDWACQRDFTSEAKTPNAASKEPIVTKNSVDENIETKSVSSAAIPDNNNSLPEQPIREAEPGILSTAAATSQSLIQRVMGTSIKEDNTSARTASFSNTSSSASFASAEEDLDITSSLHALSTKSSLSSGKPTLTAQEKELMRLANRKAELASKLEKALAKAYRDPSTPTAKEQAWVAKTQDKHDRELTKAEDRYLKATRTIEEKRVKDEEKARQQQESAAKREEDKKRRAERKEKERAEKEEMKLESNRHRAEVQKFRDEIKTLQEERDALRETVSSLQGENMKLVTLMGKLDGGDRLLAEMGIGKNGI